MKQLHALTARASCKELTHGYERRQKASELEDFSQQ